MILKFNHAAINNYAKWETVIEHNPNVLIEDFEAFPNYIYLEVREDGLPKILKMHRETLAKNYIEFSEPAFSCYLATNNDYLAEEFYYGYSSPKKPSSIFKENIDLKLKKTRNKYYFVFKQKAKTSKNPIKKFYNSVYSTDMETHTVETHIYRLRKKIKDAFNDDTFIVSHNDGYQI